MLHRHDGPIPVARLRGDAEDVRERRPLRGERVVAHGLLRFTQSGKKIRIRQIILMVKLNITRLSVQNLIRLHYFSAEMMRERLMPQTNAEERTAVSHGIVDHLTGDADIFGFFRRTRPGTHDNVTRIEALHVIHGDFVITLHNGVHSDLREHFADVVGEGIVVIDDENSCSGFFVRCR